MTDELHPLSLFIFRRDLRTDDNTGLIKALNESESVIPLFIFTPTQVSDQNKYKSSNSIQFMVESLFDLNQQIKDLHPKCQLWVTYDDEIKAISKIYHKIKFSAIYVNEDYTPYAIKRDKSIKSFCQKHNIVFDSSTDILLLDTNEIKTKTGDNYYKVFTQFYNRTVDMPIRKPNYEIGSNFKRLDKNFSKWKIEVLDKFLFKKKFYQINDNLAVNGGRTNALEIMRHLKKFKNYAKTRDNLEKQTTMLSAHNKFGTVSIREVYLGFKKKAKSTELVKQLYWRDFYYYVGIHFDEFYKLEHVTKDHNPKSKANWEDNKKFLRAWKNARTGFPIVDAAMRQINETGFMHNRGRLIVASFLVKDLLIDWKYGEKYFSQQLVDIDRAQNTGNWNWSASYGMDATSFLRIFNPWTQSEKYDPKAIYIKKWLPELNDVPVKHLHQWYKYHTEYPNIDYPAPIVEHSERRKKFKQFYDSYFK